MDAGSKSYRIHLQEMSLKDFLKEADDYGEGHIFIHECARRLRSQQPDPADACCDAPDIVWNESYTKGVCIFCGIKRIAD